MLSTQSGVRCYSALQNNDVMVGGNFNAVFHMIKNGTVNTISCAFNCAPQFAFWFITDNEGYITIGCALCVSGKQKMT